MPQAAPVPMQVSQANVGGAASAGSAARPPPAVHTSGTHCSLLLTAAALVQLGGRRSTPLVPLPAAPDYRHLLGVRGWPPPAAGAGLLSTASPPGPHRRPQVWGQQGMLVLRSSSPATHQGARTTTAAGLPMRPFSSSPTLADQAQRCRGRSCWTPSCCQQQWRGRGSTG